VRVDVTRNIIQAQPFRKKSHRYGVALFSGLLVPGYSGASRNGKQHVKAMHHIYFEALNEGHFRVYEEAPGVCPS